jgi:hypothetical protein
MFWNVLLAVGKGQGWEKGMFDAVVAEAVAAEPGFFPVDATRAVTLMPRWYGEPGEWETYAQQASDRPGGLGAEAYTRIVISLYGYHDNIFRDSGASWPRTREGIRMILEKYPKSLENLHNGIVLAAEAEDREFARELLARAGDGYLPYVWGDPKRFARVRHWVETGSF